MTQQQPRSRRAIIENLGRAAQEKAEEELEPSPVEALLGENPTPQERALVIVKRLEQFIREGRTSHGGIPFKRWQELAVHEVTNAIRDAEKHWRQDHRFIDRGFLVGAAALVTVGVWGTVLASQYAEDRQLAALVLVVSGAVLFAILAAWGIRRLDRFYQAGRRRDHLKRVINFDRQLAQLDVDLEKRLKDLEETLDEMTQGPIGKL